MTTADPPPARAKLGTKLIRRLRPGGSALVAHDRAREEFTDAMGKLQLEFLIAQGLKPDHHFLDVGCGWLRAGVNFVRYLDPDRYVGFDIDSHRLDVGRAELDRLGLGQKKAVLVPVDDFDVSRVGRKFDFAIAQSVFTHLPLNPILRCLMNMQHVLAPEGRFYATFFEAPAGEAALRDIKHPDRPPSLGPITTHFDRDPFHYNVDTFRWASERAGLRCDYVGEWDHPRSQRMLVFRLKGAA